MWSEIEAHITSYPLSAHLSVILPTPSVFRLLPVVSFCLFFHFPRLSCLIIWFSLFLVQISLPPHQHTYPHLLVTMTVRSHWTVSCVNPHPHRFRHCSPSCTLLSQFLSDASGWTPRGVVRGGRCERAES